MTITIPAAPPDAAAAHFASLLAFETDCWDVHHALTTGTADWPPSSRGTHPSPDLAVGVGFVLLDVRSPELYAAGHVPGAVSLPHGRIVERNLARWPEQTVFVVYCAGPHCNGADKAALRLARLGRPVKKMIGGVTGWLDEGFALETA
ncbi:rhodanese-like domain-containing protein [Jiangella rhizosphaerae]|uniref:Rhodanese-like domain-containing protein n=1 Tax=Jiangella rhizosphaerae TaxID=2293569 RepID=A0A418KWB8_9ACTN|nr:rhodanese-like domain-containing protein [Jiangella rhizosphaerae]RIQ35657.1 rhodanese-like domain-containing protein [Jiangella rhizosphaerae]